MSEVRASIRYTEGVLASTRGTEEGLNDLLYLLKTLNSAQDAAMALLVGPAMLADRAGPLGWTVSAIVSALQLGVTTVTGAIDFSCDLEDPPEDIKARPHGPGGDMIFQCYHHPPHCWTRGWARSDCA